MDPLARQRLLAALYQAHPLVARPATGSEVELFPIRLTDATRASGVRFVHSNGGSGRHHYVETLGGGAAFLDCDGDNRLDLLLLQGQPLPGAYASRLLRSALYRNRGDGTFVNVTAGSGLDIPVYGLGAAVGDYDNDGRPDLYITALGGNRLFHNQGGGRFRDVSRRAGTAGSDLCASAAWVDYDHDGWLDLFVCRYVEYSVKREPRCVSERGRSAYCGPGDFRRTHSLLYRNNGDGTFTDVSRPSGVSRPAGNALGVACADYDGDGRVDLFVANDLSPNHLFLSNGNGTFREEAVARGVAYGHAGLAYAGMGVDCGDYDGDSRQDIVVTNYALEPVSVFRNNEHGTFENASYPSGVGHATFPYLGWGCGLVDLDLDGRQDLFVANGHVLDHAPAHAHPPRCSATLVMALSGTSPCTAARSSPAARSLEGWPSGTTTMMGTPTC